MYENYIYSGAFFSSTYQTTMSITQKRNPALGVFFFLITKDLNKFRIKKETQQMNWLCNAQLKCDIVGVVC